MQDDERKAQIIRLIRESAAPESEPRSSGQPGVQISGNFNRNYVAAGDLHVHHHERPRRGAAPAGIGGRETWRKEICGAIWTRAAELKLSAEQVYELAGRRFHKRIAALEALSPRELGRLYEMLFTMRRPALGP